MIQRLRTSGVDVPRTEAKLLRYVLLTLLATYSPALLAQPVDTVRMQSLYEIREGRHATADSLGKISGLAIDRVGNLYASDLSAQRVWVFARDGRSLPAIGRKGRGPGEFEAPTGIAISPSGALAVRDFDRVSSFVVDSRTGRLSRFDRSFNGPPLSEWMLRRAVRFAPDGRMFYPTRESVDRSKFTARFDVYSPAGVRVDSLIVPAFPNSPPGVAFVRLAGQDGRMLQGLNHVPFAPLPVWDISPRGTIISGSGEIYVLRETTATGQVVREYRGSSSANRIPARERADSLAALRERLDAVPTDLARVEGMPDNVRRLQLPTAYPPYAAVYAAPDGLVWVRRWHKGPTGGTVFDVFDATGKLARVVVLPMEIDIFPTPHLSLTDIAAVATDPETGAQGIVRLTPRGGR